MYSFYVMLKEKRFDHINTIYYSWIFSVDYLKVYTEYPGYTRKEENTNCYKQIKGSHLDLADGIDNCNRMRKSCNGVQYMNCKNGKPKITKSLFQTKCKSKYNYSKCYVVQYIKVGEDDWNDQKGSSLVKYQN